MGCPQLREVEEEALLQIPLLISLDLSHNRYLDSLPPSSLPSSLQALDLTNCAFTSLEPDSLPPSLESLHLSDNPWHCSCHLAWLAKVIRNLLESSTEPMRRVRCLKPSLEQPHNMYREEQYLGKSLRERFLSNPPG